MSEAVAIGIDLGGTTLNIALVERDGRIRDQSSCASEAEKGPDLTIGRIVSQVDALLAERSLERADVVGAGIGTPGPLNLEQGRIIHAANLPGWRDVPLRDRLRDELQCSVVLENDGNAAAFGEYWASPGRASGEGNLVMVTLGTGVGAGVVLDGQIVHGHFDNAGELGHTIVVANGLPCSCGQRGCLEQYASASALARRVTAAIEDGEQSVLASAVSAGTLIDAEQIADAARAGDAVCVRVWDEACLYLAIACINIQHAFNPARIVLGGGMSSAGAFLLDRVQAKFDEHKWTLHDDFPVIALSALGSNAGVVGAAGLAWQVADC